MLLKLREPLATVGSKQLQDPVFSRSVSMAMEEKVVLPEGRDDIPHRRSSWLVNARIARKEIIKFKILGNSKFSMSTI